MSVDFTTRARAIAASRSRALEAVEPGGQRDVRRGRVLPLQRREQPDRLGGREPPPLEQHLAGGERDRELLAGQRPHRRRPRQSSRGGGAKTIRLSSETVAPPSRSDVTKPSWPRPPASSVVRSSPSVARSSSATLSLPASTRSRWRGRLNAVRHAHVALALGRIEPLERDHHGVALRQPLLGRGIEQRLGLLVDHVVADAAFEQAADLAEREQRAGVGDHARGERVAHRRVRAGDQQQAAGRIAQRIAGGEHPTAYAHVGLARRPLGLAGLARPLRGPAAALVVADLDAARAGGHG